MTDSETAGQTTMTDSETQTTVENLMALNMLRAIARENRADLTDRGRPIPSIFWPFNTFHQ